MNFIAYGQVLDEMFAYDKRTGQPTQQQQNTTHQNTTHQNTTYQYTIQGDIKIFKSVKCVLQVVQNKNNFEVKLMTQNHAEDYDFPKLNPETNIFYNITYDPRIIIPALLKYQTEQHAEPHAEPHSKTSTDKLKDTKSNQALLARCSVESQIITYNQRTGQEIFNQKCNMLPYRCSAVNHIVNIERRGNKFLVEMQIYGLSTYDNIKYYPATDIFGECLHDPRVIIPAIRTNPNFADYFKSFNVVENASQDNQNNANKEVIHKEVLSPEVLKILGLKQDDQNSVYQNTQHQNIAKPEDLKKLPPHIKYVDIQGLRVVYDSKTGEEIEHQTMQGVEKPALHVDECNGLLCDDYEFIVFFLSNNAENVCRVVYNYHTGIFTGLTADPRIIIPYIRQSAEFNEYLKILQSTQERKKLTDDMQIKDYFTPSSAACSYLTPQVFNNTSAVFDNTSAVFDNTSSHDAFNPPAMPDTKHIKQQINDDDVPGVILNACDTEPNQNEISDSNTDYPPLAIYEDHDQINDQINEPVDEPHGIDDVDDVDQWAKRMLHNKLHPYDIYPMFSHSSYSSYSSYSSTMQKTKHITMQKTDEEIREEQEQKEIEDFELMAADEQQKILLHKIEIVRSKLREKQLNLQFLHHRTPDDMQYDMQQDKTTESNIIVEPFVPAVKFTPRENNVYMCTAWLTNIPKAQQHDAQQHDAQEA
jgi:hypothetical protein